MDRPTCGESRKTKFLQWQEALEVVDIYMTHEVMGSHNKKYPLILQNSIVFISNIELKCDQLVKPKIRVRESTQVPIF